MIRHIRILALILCMAGALAGCRGNLLHSAYQAMPDAQWDGQEPLLFSLPVVDEPWEGSLTVNVRTRNRFAYKQVVVHVEVYCDEKCVEDRLLTVTMHHPDEVLMPDLLYEDNYSEPIPLRLDPGKRYKLRLSHRMRLNPLDHVAFVGYDLQGEEEEKK